MFISAEKLHRHWTGYLQEGSRDDGRRGPLQGFEQVLGRDSQAVRLDLRPRRRRGRRVRVVLQRVAQLLHAVEALRSRQRSSFSQNSTPWQARLMVFSEAQALV